MPKGPITKRGKDKSSKNALTHGLTSTQLLNEQESNDYEYIYAELEAEYEPKGITEHLLIQRCAQAYVRLQRTVLAESSAFEMAKLKSRLSTDLIDDLGLPIEAVRTYALNVEAGNYDYNDPKTTDRLATYLQYFKEATAIISAKGYGSETIFARHARLIHHCIEGIAVNHDVTFGQLFSSEKGVNELVDCVMQLGEVALSDGYIASLPADADYLWISKDPVEEFFHKLAEKLNLQTIGATIHPIIQRATEIQNQAAFPDTKTLETIARHSTATNNQFSKALAELRHVVEERRRQESLSSS